MSNLVSTAQTGIDRLGRQSYIAYHDYFSVYRKFLAEHEAITDTPLDSARILDFGCGYNFPALTLLSEDVREAHGIDIIDVFHDDSVFKHLDQMGALETAQRYVTTKAYYRYLEWFADKSPNTQAPILTSYGGKELPYEQPFDIIYSNGVLHLIDNYEEILSELSRVIADGGYLNINVRNEASLHGYDTPNCTHSDFEAGAPRPWAHLRDWSPSELGLFGPDDYEAIFEQLREAFEEVHIYFSDRTNNLVKHDASLDLPTENAALFRWEDDAEVTEEIREETGIDSEEFLRSRSFKIIAIA